MDWKKKETWVYLVNTIAAVALTIIGLVFGGMMPSPPEVPDPAPIPSVMADTANDALVEFYAANADDIDPVWVALPEHATMRDAVAAYLDITPTPSPDEDPGLIDPKKALGAGFFLALANLLIQWFFK